MRLFFRSVRLSRSNTDMDQKGKSEDETKPKRQICGLKRKCNDKIK